VEGHGGRRTLGGALRQKAAVASKAAHNASRAAHSRKPRHAGAECSIEGVGTKGGANKDTSLRRRAEHVAGEQALDFWRAFLPLLGGHVSKEHLQSVKPMPAASSCERGSSSGLSTSAALAPRGLD
jgi:hypothetical protein